jgi:hypothetical protein
MLIAIDLDGTLLTPENTITPETVQALRKARDHGHRLILISARPPFGMAPYADQIDLKDYLIAYNGAFILNRKDGGVLLDRPLAADDTRTIVEIVRAHDAYTGYYVGQEWYVEKVCEEMRLEQRAQKQTPNIVEDLVTQAPDRAHKCIILDLAEDHQLPVIYEDITSQLPHLNAHYSSPYSIEISSQSASKGAALEFFAGYIGMDGDAVLAVGDGHNDLSMLNYAGVGVAVVNAPDEVKDAADWVVAANDAGGIVELVERVLAAGSEGKG